MAILGVLISAVVYRVMLGVAQSVRQRLYVDAARVNGLGSLRVNLVHVLPSMATVVAVQAAQLYRHRPGDRRRPGLPRIRSGGAGAELGLHDPGRFRAPLRRAVADGADRRGAGAHRGRRQRARRRHRRQGGRGRAAHPPQEARGAVPRPSACRRGGRACTRRPERRTAGQRPVRLRRRRTGAGHRRLVQPAARARCSAWSASPAAARR